jgi:DNA (cytosine-5)-methyltransferase 1
MALGFEQAGFDVLAAVDLDPVHLAAHERNFPLCEPLCTDITELQAEVLTAAARRGWERRHPGTRFAGRVDCVFGGPSCQGFSVIGSRDPADPRNGLVAQFARVVTELRPRWFVMENVPGLVSPAYQPALRAVCETLERAGYQVAEPWVLNARDHQVPQERKRVFLVGARRGEHLPTSPTPSVRRVSVADALDDLPALGRFRTLLERDAVGLSAGQLATMRERQTQYVRRLNGLERDPRDFSDPRLWNTSRLSSVGLTVHSPDVVTRFTRLRAGQRDTIGRLPRLDGDGQAPTLRAGTGRDHGSFTSARPVHHRRPRVIVVREAARLHGLPDWFGLHATKWHGFRQVGNSVPPPLARAVAQRVVTAARVIPTRRSGTPISLGSDHLLQMTLSDGAKHYGLESSKLPINVRRPALSTKEGLA